MTANKARLNVQIVNLSLGHPIWAPAANDPLVQAVQQATAAGLIVVTSAGNKGKNQATGLPGYAGVTSPCNAPSAICVGAANTQNTVGRSDDAVTLYSSRGPSWYDGYSKPDVIAPGHRLPSDISTSSYLYQALQTSQGRSSNGQPLLSLSGTSMAAGVTSGVVALVLDAHNRNPFHKQNDLTANGVKAILHMLGDSTACLRRLVAGHRRNQRRGRHCAGRRDRYLAADRLVVAGEGRDAFQRDR